MQGRLMLLHEFRSLIAVTSIVRPCLLPLPQGVECTIS